MKIKSKKLKDIVWLSKKENNFRWTAPCISNTCCFETEYYAHIEIINEEYTGDSKDLQDLLNLNWVIFICKIHKSELDNFINEKELYKEPTEEEVNNSFLKFFEVISRAIIEKDKIIENDEN